MRKVFFGHVLTTKAQISLLRACTDNEGPDQPAHACSLSRLFPVRSHRHWILLKTSKCKKGPDQIVWLHVWSGSLLFAVWRNFLWYRSHFISALDKVLNNWVFWAIFTHPFLIELGIRIFPLNTLLCKWVQELLIIGYLPHRFNSNCFFQAFNWVNIPKSSLSKVLFHNAHMHYNLLLIYCL